MEITSSLKKIEQKFRPERLITEPADLITYEVDAALDRGTPDAVILPQSTEEVRDIIGWAHKHQIPVTARGAGTGLAGGAVAVAGGVILHFSRMKKLLELDLLGYGHGFFPDTGHGYVLCDSRRLRWVAARRAKLTRSRRVLRRRACAVGLRGR